MKIIINDLINLRKNMDKLINQFFKIKTSLSKFVNDQEKIKIPVVIIIA